MDTTYVRSTPQQIALNYLRAKTEQARKAAAAANRAAAYLRENCGAEPPAESVKTYCLLEAPRAWKTVTSKL